MCKEEDPAKIDMLIQDLPPVWSEWSEEDLDRLTIVEREALHLMLYKKMNMVADNFDKRIIFLCEDRKKKYEKIFTSKS